MAKTDYNIHNILNVQSGVDGIVPEYFKVDKHKNGVDLKVNIRNRVNIKNSVQIAPNSYWSKERGSIVFLIRKFGLDFFIEVLDLFSDQTIINVSRSYLVANKLIVKMPISGIFPFDHFMKMIIQIKLLQKGYSFMIASGVLSDTQNSLFFGYGGIGKTSISLAISKTKKYRFFSDDTVITDGKLVYSYPSKIRLRNRSPTILSKEKYVSPLRIYRKISTTMKVNNSYILIRREKMVVDSKGEFINRIMDIHKKIIPLNADTIINNSFFCQGGSLKDYEYLQEKIISSLVTKTKMGYLTSMEGVGKG